MPAAAPSDIPDPALSIGALARETDVNVRTIRYYEAAGLLPAPARTAGNHRLYGAPHRRRLAFVRHARQLGFTMEDIRELLRVADAPPDAPCTDADGIAHRHLAGVRARLARLRSLEAELERMTGCHDGRIGSCRVIEVLADAGHGHCADPTHGGEAALD